MPRACDESNSGDSEPSDCTDQDGDSPRPHARFTEERTVEKPDVLLVHDMSSGGGTLFIKGALVVGGTLQCSGLIMSGRAGSIDDLVLGGDAGDSYEFSDLGLRGVLEFAVTSMEDGGAVLCRKLAKSEANSSRFSSFGCDLPGRQGESLDMDWPSGRGPRLVRSEGARGGGVFHYSVRFGQLIPGG